MRGAPRRASEEVLLSSLTALGLQFCAVRVTASRLLFQKVIMEVTDGRGWTT